MTYNVFGGTLNLAQSMLRMKLKKCWKGHWITELGASGGQVGVDVVTYIKLLEISLLIWCNIYIRNDGNKNWHHKMASAQHHIHV